MREVTDEQYRYLDECSRLAVRVEYGLRTDTVLADVKRAERDWVQAGALAAEQDWADKHREIFA